MHASMSRRQTSVALCAAVLGVVVVLSAAEQCPNFCSGRGECSTTTSTCTCYEGYTGPDCSDRACPSGPAWFDMATSADTAHASVECSNNGICDRSTGLCKCRDGFSGQACEQIGCHNGCSGHGQCFDLEMAARIQDDIRLLTTTTYTLWDKNNVCGCVCDEGYTGYDCSLRECPFGHDPLDTWEVDEVQVISCQCDTTCSGGIKLTFKDQTTATIAHNAVAMISDENSAVTTAGTGRGESVQAKLQALRAIHGVSVTMSGSSICTDSSAGTTSITFTHDPGDLPALVATSSLVTSGSTTTVSVTADGSGSSVTGTKTSKECSGRGTCDRSTGECVCYADFGPSDRTGGSGDVLDCGYNTTTITACPGDCSVHGTCSADSAYECTCWEGYKGYDCNERECPFGIAWWDEPSATDTAHTWAECSNKGICNVATGVCDCQKGFSGRACERLACPKANGEDCSGRGKCMTLTRAQQFKTVNGNPPGDLEVQSFTCSATSGTIALSFNGFTTDAFAFGSTAAQVKAALEALPVIGLVDVSFDSGSAVCSGSSPTTSVTFLTEHGNQPEITSTSTGVSSTATEVTQGSRKTYGTNYIAATWDYNKVTGCVCDHDNSYNKSSIAYLGSSTGDILDYKGFDCSLRTCPSGNDPLAPTTKRKEVQNVTCTASSGTFTVTFRQATTAAIAYNANAAAVETALEAIATIGDVSVETDVSNTACSGSGETWAVTFNSELGNLPLMTATHSTGTISVGESTQGTTDNVECSNRGKCDYKLGVCKCFDGFVSGDSSGSALAGTRGDCGHQDALFKSS